MRSILCLLAGALVAVFVIGAASPAQAQWCPIPFYITNANDLIKFSGKFYDNAGNEKKVKCTVPFPSGAYMAFTGGSADPPGRSFQGLLGDVCGPELTPLSLPLAIAGRGAQVVKNGKAKNQCVFVGRQPDLSSGAGPHEGISMTTVLKFDAAGNFRSEKGVINYNFEDGTMFVGKFLVRAR